MKIALYGGSFDPVHAAHIEVAKTALRKQVADVVWMIPTYQNPWKTQASASYAERVMQSVPTHLKKVKEYELQSVFQSDGWFLLHCLLVLLHNGKLEEPNPSQRKSLMTVVTHE